MTPTPTSRIAPSLIATVRRFIASDDGATAIEYGMIGAMVSVAAMTALGAMGDNIVAVFDISANAVNASLPEAG